ncbi:DUF2867 domain-containing protein [Ferrovibrio sp.]|uniref:DUF2867 domain-containing protein n=1 Tax=Ferrovibrio sp. TaxID=1917215 RepID=UPI00311F2314
MAAVTSTSPDPFCKAALPGCNFADAFAVTVPQPAIDPARVMTLAFATPPGWVSGLMTVRNAVMGRLGYKAPPLRRGFPVLQSGRDFVLSGLDDGHLDFRALVRVSPSATGGSHIVLTTAVRTRNRFGRAYLAVILPFHRLIVRSMLRRAARQIG